MSSLTLVLYFILLTTKFVIKFAGVAFSFHIERHSCKKKTSICHNIAIYTSYDMSSDLETSLVYS